MSSNTKTQFVFVSGESKNVVDCSFVTEDGDNVWLGKIMKDGAKKWLIHDEIECKSRSAAANTLYEDYMENAVQEDENDDSDEVCETCELSPCACETHGLGEQDDDSDGEAPDEELELKGDVIEENEGLGIYLCKHKKAFLLFDAACDNADNPVAKFSTKAKAEKEFAKYVTDAENEITGDDAQDDEEAVEENDAPESTQEEETTPESKEDDVPEIVIPDALQALFERKSTTDAEKEFVLAMLKKTSKKRKSSGSNKKSRVISKKEFVLVALNSGVYVSPETVNAAWKMLSPDHEEFNVVTFIKNFARGGYYKTKHADLAKDKVEIKEKNGEYKAVRKNLPESYEAWLNGIGKEKVQMVKEAVVAQS